MLQKIQQRLHDIISSGELDNLEIIQLIEQLGNYLNIQTIAQKAKYLGVDYNCVKMSNIQKVELFGVKFVIDND